MGEDKSIASLRARIASLVDEEGALVAQALKASREGGGQSGVDVLFAQVQALQAERNRLQKQVGGLLGTRRLHVAAEVWQPGVYDYRSDDGETSRVRVTQGPLGLQVQLPGRKGPVRIETLRGDFDGPIGSDDPASG
jgi:hypothetical protein